ncbi:MAG: 50S ribosomal protein L13 [Candidatus Omnitrophota bacterium]|nr:50S ribosomal protein L13 [Candidatus Omnitrophota bacterium]
MKTYAAKSKEVKRNYFVANADGKVLGRLAARVAVILSGKHKPVYTPHVDTGDYVVIINADKVKVTGKKAVDKIYRRYSGYPGGLKELNFETLLKKRPRDIIRLAVKNMLPKNKLARKMLRKLKLYVASEKPVLPKKAKQVTI